jgi:hypothetical protein
MAKSSYIIDEDIEIIIDSPVSLSPNDSLPILISVAIENFGQNHIKQPVNKYGFFSMKIGGIVYQIMYQVKVKRVLSALEAYSSAISFVRNNAHLYDPYLLRVAIEELQRRFNRRLS